MESTSKLRSLPINRQAEQIIRHQISYGGRGPVDALDSTLEIICRRFTRYPVSVDKIDAGVQDEDKAIRQAVRIVEQALNPWMFQVLARKIQKRENIGMTLREIESELFNRAKNIVASAIMNPVWHGDYVIRCEVSIQEIRVNTIEPIIQYAQRDRGITSNSPDLETNNF